MALPITYVEEITTNGVDGSGSTYMYVYRSKQAKPYDRPATYVKKQGYTHAASRSGGYLSYGGLADVAFHKDQRGWGPDVNNTFLQQINQSRNNAYEKFAEEAKGAEAMVAVNIAEFNQSLDMIESRSKQLLLFCNDLRRRNFAQAARRLGVKIPKGVKYAGKNIADVFLEFHFGWEPLIGDIGSSVEILQGDLPSKYIRCRSKRVDRTISVNTDDGVTTRRYGTKARIQTSASARVKISNPQLHMADQLGFVNPLSIAWELVPFSFVVDWFVPVSAFLNSFTDFLGLDIDDACHFTLIRTPYWYYHQSLNSGLATMDITTTGMYASRTLGIPSVTLVPRCITGISPTRAATSLSLLLQQGLRGLR